MMLAKKNEFYINLDTQTYLFYYEIAKLSKQSIENILSDTLYKCADLIEKRVAECIENGKEAE